MAFVSYFLISTLVATCLTVGREIVCVAHAERVSQAVQVQVLRHCLSLCSSLQWEDYA